MARDESGGPVADAVTGPVREDERTAVQLVLAIGRSFKYIDAYVRPRMLKMGLTMTEFSVLSVLYHNGPTPLGELSQRILLTGASTTYTVKKLEDRGLLERQTSSGDGRIVHGLVTEKGKKLLQRVYPKHGQDLLAAQRNLTLEEKKTVVRLLQKLQTNRHEEPTGPD